MNKPIDGERVLRRLRSRKGQLAIPTGNIAVAAHGGILRGLDIAIRIVREEMEKADDEER